MVEFWLRFWLMDGCLFFNCLFFRIFYHFVLSTQFIEFLNFFFLLLDTLYLIPLCWLSFWFLVASHFPLQARHQFFLLSVLAFCLRFHLLVTDFFFEDFFYFLFSESDNLQHSKLENTRKLLFLTSYFVLLPNTFLLCSILAYCKN